MMPCWRDASGDCFRWDMCAVGYSELNALGPDWIPYVVGIYRNHKRDAFGVFTRPKQFVRAAPNRAQCVVLMRWNPRLYVANTRTAERDYPLVFGTTSVMQLSTLPQQRRSVCVGFNPIQSECVCTPSSTSSSSYATQFARC